MNATSRDPKDELLDHTATYRYSSSPSAEPQRGSAEPGPHRYAFHSGDRPLEGYTIKRAIGRGGFGEVYYAVSDAGKEVALKLITRNLEIERRGVLHCMNLKSPHLITIFDLRTNEHNDTFVIMEYVSGPSLASILAEHPQGLPLPEVRAWLQGLVAGVAYLHEHGIVHRDLKPANLFLEEGVVKIGDYGLSKSIASTNDAGMSENVGTCHYMAPEISRGKYHRPIDIYAVGIILFEMITGGLPFEGETAQEILWKHLTDQPDLSKLPEPYRTLVRRALAKDPNHRPQRIQDLLPPQDAPKEAEIRFLERQPSAVAPPVVPSEPPRSREKEDILVIRDEEPVLYIGPETPAPPRRRIFQRASARDQRRQAHPQQRQSRHRSSQRPPMQVQFLVTTSPAEPLEPPPLPAPRLRLAEAAGSMFAAAPLAALGAALALPTFGPLDVPLPQDPMQLAYLALMVLLGTWSLIITTKFWEGRDVARSTRRLVLLGLGLAFGAGGLYLADWTHLIPAPTGVLRTSWDLDQASSLVRNQHLDPFLFAGYFGLVFPLLGWWKLTARDRSSRFALWPVVKTGLVGVLLGLVVPSAQPWSVLVLILMSILLQLVSPWSRDAAAFASAQRTRQVA